MVFAQSLVASLAELFARDTGLPRRPGKRRFPEGVLHRNSRGNACRRRHPGYRMRFLPAFHIAFTPFFDRHPAYMSDYTDAPFAAVQAQAT